MNRKKARALYTALFLCMAAAGLTACGSDNSTDSEDTAVVGRVTSVSDSELQMEVFDMDSSDREGKGDKFPGASGGAISGAAVGDGEKPEGMPDGTPPAGDGEDGKPQGTPPADGEDAPDAKDGDGKQQSDGKDRNDAQGPAGESKTYTISSDTKIYKQDGDEKTEITLDELDPGSMVSVEADGDEAESITVQNNQMQKDSQQ